MATVVQTFFARGFSLPGSNFGRFKAVSGTNFPAESIALAKTAGEERLFLEFRSRNYGSGNVTIRVRWYADTASSGDIVLGASLAAITPNTDTQDIETKAFGTEATATDSHLGTTGQRLHEMTITVSSLDSLAADDWVELMIRRKNDAGDTMTGDALIKEVDVEYSDT